MTATIREEAIAMYGRHSLRPMRSYQLEMALSRERVLYAPEQGEVWEQIELVARQGGKNEMDAQFSVRNLKRLGHMRRKQGQSLALAIKTAPSYKPGVALSKRRFDQTVAETPCKLFKRDGYIYQLDDDPAGLAFLSAGTEANKRGETAALWMSVDECQDTSQSVYDAELAPMRSSTAAPVFFSGTMRGEECLANVMLQRLQAEQDKAKAKGAKHWRRVFVYDWETIANYNEDYGRFVQRERDRMKADNPIFLAEYCLIPMKAIGVFFTPEDIDLLLSGRHERGVIRGAQVLVGAVDFSGVEETPEDGLWDPNRQKRRDSTVAGVGMLRWKRDEDGLHPILQVLDVLWMVNENPVATVDRLYNFLFVKYGCVKVVLDGSGVGDAPAAMLEARHGGCEVIKSSSTDVTRMGWNLLAMVKSGRCTLFAEDGSRDRAEMVTQCRELRRVVRANQTLKWEAPANQPLVNGVATAVHDDGPKMLGYLVEAAHKHVTGVQPTPPLREFTPWAEAQGAAYGQEAA